MSFARYVRHLFNRIPLGDCFSSKGKYITNKLGKNVSKGKKKRETTGKKSNDKCRKKLKHYDYLKI